MCLALTRLGLRRSTCAGSNSAIFGALVADTASDPGTPLPCYFSSYVFVPLGAAVRIVRADTGVVVRVLQTPKTVTALCLNPQNSLQVSRGEGVRV